MVLTRHQERMLMYQYHGALHQSDPPHTPPKSDDNNDHYPAPPSSTHPRTTALPDGRLLKSALKTHTRLRPWESEGEEGVVRALETGDESHPSSSPLRKRVRIDSNSNVVHLFRSLSNAVSEDQQQGSGLHTRNKGNGVHVMEWSLALLALLGWALSSSWLIFLNRDLMRYKGFPFPLMLPAVSQLGCAAMAWSCRLLPPTLISIRPWELSQFTHTLGPLVIVIVLSMFLGNFAYLGLSVAFLNILKALTPAVTLALSATAGQERFTPVAFLSTLLIAYGTGVATVQETTNNASFHWLSFASFTASVVFEGLRVVLAAWLLGGMSKPYNPIEMLAHVGPVVFVIMAVASVTVGGERPQLLALGASGVIKILPDIAIMCLLSFAVNLTSYYAIMHTSSTTFKVVGCFRNAVVIWMSMMQGDVVNRRQWQGFAVSTAGFLLYTWAKRSSSSPSSFSSSLTVAKTDKSIVVDDGEETAVMLANGKHGDEGESEEVRERRTRTSPRQGKTKQL